MTVSEIIDGILERKSELNATVQQIADASGVPKSTVDNILRKATANPTIQNVLDIANAVGYEFSPREKVPVDAEDEKLKHIIYIYEKRCEALEKESRLKTVQANMQLADKERVIETKDKWIHRLFDSLVFLAVGVMVVLLLDVLIRGVGWFP